MKKSFYLLIALLLVITVPAGISNSVKAVETNYSLSVNIIGSGIVAVNGSSPYSAGSVVQLTAYPSDGWEFTQWNGDVLGTANPELLLMDSNKSVTVTFTEIPEYIPAIDSCDSLGVAKDIFDITDDVYVKGTGYLFFTTYNLYVVEDEAVWSDGMTIPARVSGTATTVSSDAGGNVPPTLAWADPLAPGKYDIVVDVNGNGIYDTEVDALDDSDIQVTAGFFVVPEVPLGTLMTSLAMIIGLVCYFTFPKIRKI